MVVSESTPEPRPGSETSANQPTPDANQSASGGQASPPSTPPSGTRPQTPRPADPADSPDTPTSVDSAKRAVGSAAKKLRGFSAGLSARAAKFAANRQKPESDNAGEIVAHQDVAASSTGAGQAAANQPATDGPSAQVAATAPQSTLPSEPSETSAANASTPTPGIETAPAASAASAVDNQPAEPTSDGTRQPSDAASTGPAGAATGSPTPPRAGRSVPETASRKLGRLVSDEDNADQPGAIKPPNSPTTAQITRTQQRPIVQANPTQRTNTPAGSAGPQTSPNPPNSNVQRLPGPGDTTAAAGAAAASATGTNADDASANRAVPGITTVPKPDRANTTAGVAETTQQTPDNTSNASGIAQVVDNAAATAPQKAPTSFVSTLLGYKLVHGGLALATTLLVFVALLAAGNLAATKQTAAAFGAVALVLFARFTLRWWIDPIIAKRAMAAKPLDTVCAAAGVAAVASVAVIATRNVIATLIAGAITGLLAAGLDFGGRTFATVVTEAPQQSSLRRTARLWSSGGVAAAAALLFVTGVATAQAGLETAQLTLAIVAFVAAFASCVLALNLRSTNPAPVNDTSTDTKTYGLAALHKAITVVPTPVSRGLILTGVLGVAVPALIAPLAVPRYGAAGLATIIISVIVGLLVGSWLAGLRRVHNYIQPVSFLGLIGSAISCFLVELFVMQAVWAVFCGLWIGFLTVAGVGELGRNTKNDAPAESENGQPTVHVQPQESFEQARTIPQRVAEGAAPILAAVAALAAVVGLSAPWAAAAVAGIAGIAAIALCVVPGLRNRDNTAAAATSAHPTNNQGRPLRPSEVARAAAAQSTLTARQRPEPSDQPTPATDRAAVNVPSIVVADDEEYTTADRRLDPSQLDNPTTAKIATVAATATATAAVATPAEPPEENQRTLGWFIAIEGGDGAGKSTVVAALATAIQERSKAETIITREPGGTAQGTALRELLLHQNDWSPRAEALLFAADRAQHVHQIIRPALDRDAIVITDRYVDSSIAYQGAGRDLGHDEILALSSWGTMNLSPDLTILLDVDPAVAAKRREADPRRSAPDRMEREDLSFHNRVRTLFLERAETEPDRYLVVDASVGRDAVVAQVLQKALPLLGLPVDPVYTRSALAGTALVDTPATTDTTSAPAPVDSAVVSSAPAGFSSTDSAVSTQADQAQADQAQADLARVESPAVDSNPISALDATTTPAAVSADVEIPAPDAGINTTDNELKPDTELKPDSELTNVLGETEAEATERTEYLGANSANERTEMLNSSAIVDSPATPADEPTSLDQRTAIGEPAPGRHVAPEPAPEVDPHIATNLDESPTNTVASGTPAATQTPAEFPTRRDRKKQTEPPAAPHPDNEPNATKPLDRSGYTPHNEPTATAPLANNDHFPWENTSGTPSEGQPVDNLNWRRTPAEETTTWSSLDDVFGTPTQDATITFEDHEEYGTEGGDTRQLPSAQDIVDLRNQTEDSRSRRRRFAAAERARREAEARKQRDQHDQ